MKLNKLVLAATVASSIFLVGCGDDKTEAEINFDQQVKLKAMDQAHEREMERIAARKLEAANPESHTYIENDYEQDQQQYNGTSSSETFGKEEYQGEQSDSSEMGSYSNGGGNYSTDGGSSQNYSEQNQSSTMSTQTQSTPTTEADSGFGVGSMVLAAAGGAAAGYFAGELLNNGMKSYKDESGATHYTDKDGRPVSKTAYEDHKKKNPKTTAFKEKASSLKSKTKAGATKAWDKTKEVSKKGLDKSKELGKKGIDKTKKTYNNVKANPKVKNFADKAKYQGRKTKVLSKKAAKKVVRKAKKVGGKRR